MESQSNAGRWYLTAVGVALCLIAGLFLWLMGRSYLRAKEMTSWPQVPCLILRSEIAERRIGENVAPDFKFSVLYRYQFQEKDYESNRLGLRGSMPRNDRSVVEEMIAAYPLGSLQKCWVNPHQPEVAILELDSRAAGYSLWFPGLFFIGGVGMIVGAWKNAGKSKATNSSVG